MVEYQEYLDNKQSNYEADRAWEQKRKGNNASSSSSNNASRVIIIFITTIHFIEIENERKFLCTVYIYVC